jgi:hypothetical protein
MIRGEDPNTVSGGIFDSIYSKETNKKEFKAYSKIDCANEIQKNIEIEQKSSPLFKDYGKGIYSIEGAYGRYVCVASSDIKDDMINKSNFFISLTGKFWDEYSQQIPNKIREEDFVNYSLFPLDNR